MSLTNILRRVLPTVGIAVLLLGAAQTLRAEETEEMKQAEDSAGHMLTMNKWNFHGVTRIFSTDGTWTSVNNPNKGTWAFKDGVLTVIFHGGFVINFPLPLNPQGTYGKDSQGNDDNLYEEGHKGRSDPTAPNPKDTPPDDLSLLGTKEPTGRQSREEAIRILTTGGWLFEAGKPAHVYVFFRDGTYTFFRFDSDTSVKRLDTYGGKWEVADQSIIITDNSGTQTTCELPIKPTGLEIRKASGETAEIKPSTRVPTVEQLEAPVVSKKSHPPKETPASNMAMLRGSIVCVTGNAMAGNGFVVKIGSAGNYLITNAKVAAAIQAPAFQALDGTKMPPGTASIAIGADIFCMSLPAGTGTGAPFEIMENVDQNAQVGDAVVVLGNAEGGGTVNSVSGKIVGIGPSLVEVDAPFLPGSNGAPIVHVKSGKVIGVATYVAPGNLDYKTMARVKNPQVHRFAFRLDAVKSWQPLSWPAFRAQAAQMEAVKERTVTLAALCTGIAAAHGGAVPVAQLSPEIRSRYDDWMAAKAKHLDAEDAKESDAEFLAFLKKMSTSDIATMQSQSPYDIFRRELTAESESRADLTQALQNVIREAGQ